jgi:hypothetical protein
MVFYAGLNKGSINGYQSSEVWMEAASGWITTHKLAHFEKAIKI